MDLKHKRRRSGFVSQKLGNERACKQKAVIAVERWKPGIYFLTTRVMESFDFEIVKQFSKRIDLTPDSVPMHIR